ncbi:amino acid adenylation domain-containing protein [Streptomyces sp. NPDC018045]|uniref:amino acid adenylation domain-containing protein n=1 Tax=Streptomyces sp. NPDC018045 TaxID=3365037 RepID=UPI0037BB8974
MNDRTTRKTPISLVDAFRATTAAHPLRTAVKCAGRSLTYADLDRESSRLAAHIRKTAPSPGQPVAILLDRSVEMVVAAVAVLKAGASYLPLDPASPPARNAYIVEEAAPAAVVTSPRPAAGLPPGIDRILVEECLRDDGPDADPESEPIPAEQRAYVIFTSGTTGRPKGVEVSHANLLRLFSATENIFGFTADDVWTVFHSFAFDFSVWEIWGALLYGGCAVLVPGDVAKDPAAFRHLLERERVTVLNQTPSAFRQLAAEDARHAGRLPLRHVVFGGEALNHADLAGWTDKYGDATPSLVNMYGITETTVHASYHRIRRPEATAGPSVIGRPLPDLDLLLVDADLGPVAPGEAGEIVVTGPGVSLGYLGRPELTAERFVTLPGRDGRPVRGYRSGDLARRRADGLLEFLGRADSQVKIRGFRIELGEVEAALARHPGVRQAVATVREARDGTPRLLGYVVPAPGTAPDPGAVRAHAARELPSYMVPAAIGTLDALPLTGNGKLDRAALPDVTATGRSVVAPRTAEETVLCALFAEMLEREPVGVHDDFFELGGHSLLATGLLLRIRAAFGEPRHRKLPLSRIYRTPTVAGLARWLGQESPPGTPAPPPEAEPAGLLGPQQADMLVRHVFDPDGLTEHCTMGWRVDGELDIAALRRAVGHLHRRHESLRTSYRLEEEPVAEPADVAPPEVTVRTAPTAGRARTVLRDVLGQPFRLEAAEIWRAAVVTVEGSASHLLGVAAHHIAVDGWSESIMARELAAAYAAERAGRAPALPPAPTLEQVARARRAHLDGVEVTAQQDHWRAELAGIPQLVYPQAPDGLGSRGHPRVLEVPLPPGALDQVARCAQAYGTTPYAVLLTAYGRAVAEVAGQPDFGVGTPIALRGDSVLDTAVSCLIDVLCMRLRFAAGATDAEDLAAVSATVRGAFAAQDVPFGDVVRLLNPPRDERPPLFQTMFALQNHAPAPLDLPGARSAFFRPAPFGIPVELVAELRPYRADGPHLVVSHRPDRVPAAFATALGACFPGRLARLTAL